MALTCYDAYSIYNSNYIIQAHNRARAASGTFRSNPLSDAELLNDSQLIARERLLETQSRLSIEDCYTATGVMERYTDQITTLLNLPAETLERGRINISRFLRSNRLSPNEMETFIRTLPHNLMSPEADELANFRRAATYYFMHANLFYYEYIPAQGAVMCYNR